MSRPDDRRVFHVLPEAEPFSEYDGGAISRWVANVLVNDSSGIVVCPSSDGSWVFDNARVLQMKGLRRYGRIRRLAMKLTAGPRKRIIRVLLRELIRTTNPSGAGGAAGEAQDAGCAAYAQLSFAGSKQGRNT
jgi:hypothetical protein